MNGQGSLGGRGAFRGFLARKGCWTLSPPAKFLAVAASSGFILAAIRLSQPFLAVTNRMHGVVFVVDDWIPGYALEQAVALTKTGDD